MQARLPLPHRTPETIPPVPLRHRSCGVSCTHPLPKQYACRLCHDIHSTIFPMHAVHKSIRWFVTPLNKTPRRRFDSWRLRRGFLKPKALVATGPSAQARLSSPSRTQGLWPTEIVRIPLQRHRDVPLVERRTALA